MKANECKYTERDRRLKEQFINGINDDEMVTEIIHELITVSKTGEITNEQVFAWSKEERVH